MKGYIEEVGVGHGEIKLPFGFVLKETKDELYISNGLFDLWIFNIFTGYRQIGVYKIERPHDFKWGDWVDIGFDEKGHINFVRRWER